MLVLTSLYLIRIIQSAIDKISRWLHESISPCLNFVLWLKRVDTLEGCYNSKFWTVSLTFFVQINDRLDGKKNRRLETFNGKNLACRSLQPIRRLHPAGCCYRPAIDFWGKIATFSYFLLRKVCNLINCLFFIHICGDTRVKNKCKTRDKLKSLTTGPS